jgi:hypothetical protein
LHGAKFIKVGIFNPGEFCCRLTDHTIFQTKLATFRRNPRGVSKAGLRKNNNISRDVLKPSHTLADTLRSQYSVGIFANFVNIFISPSMATLAHQSVYKWLLFGPMSPPCRNFVSPAKQFDCS